jgi:hypothetical protein
MEELLNSIGEQNDDEMVKLEVDLNGANIIHLDVSLSLFVVYVFFLHVRVWLVDK